MGDRSLTYDANAARPGLTFTPPSTPGMQIPTPMGWLSPDVARQMLNHMAPNREAVADTLGVPMDGVAWAARQLGAKGIPGGYGKADPVTQMLSNVLYPGQPHQPQWKPSADVLGSSQNILRFLNQHVPPGGLF